jgi:two-component system, LuxR family, response regulator FixJ
MGDAKLNILIVDDDESVRDSLRLMLESSGYSACTFKSAEDLLDSGFGENSFCLILDIRLPGMSGFKLQEHLLKSQNTIPVIFITGHDRDRMEEEARRLGAIAYIRKPFDEQHLLDAIRLVEGSMISWSKGNLKKIHPSFRPSPDHGVPK